MARIKKIIRWENRDDYARVYVQLEDGMEAVIMIGGDVETYFSHGTIKAFVKKTKA